MKKEFLFPHSWRIAGWILAIPSLILGLFLITDLMPFELFEKYSYDQGYVDELISACLIGGLILVAFSREREEDEYIARLRLSSLIWALIVNYVLFMIATLTVYGFNYLYVLFVMPFLILILFVVIFRIALYRFRKTYDHEE